MTSEDTLRVPAWMRRARPPDINGATTSVRMQAGHVRIDLLLRSASGLI